jgi:arginine deiminase
VRLIKKCVMLSSRFTETRNAPYKQRLRNHGVDATWMDFGALTSGYGAAHCTTQVLVREAKP